MIKQLLLSTFMLSSLSAMAQKAYNINIGNVPDKQIIDGKLKLGGSNPEGHRIGVNNYYLTLDGKPMIATMGEMHYSRIPREQWEEQILKLKAGGINVIATYVFWALHEPHEGDYRWDGNLDLHHFLELCKKHNMWTIVRIGPFCHGEMRSGSIPDWMYGRPFQIRTNDDEYLKYVSRHWDNVAKQLKGEYYQDGGIVVGIQLENELQHSASPWAFGYPRQPLEFTVADYDVDNTHIGVQQADKPMQAADMGEKHMATLKALAESKGIKAPLLTATGWGYAAIMPNECIPVTSCYPYNWWDEKLNPSKFYLFKDMTKEPDYSPVRYNPSDYPSFSAEIGIGNQHVYWRRATPADDSPEALVIRALGSGSNGVGYYMYQGGTTPRNDVNFQSDHPMGLPLMSYDFKAPLAEFGFTRRSYHQLKLLHLFTEDFGDKLAPMGVVLPDGAAKMSPTDDSVLRYAVRKKGNGGFVFFDNFQDHAKRHDLQGVSINIEAQGENIRFPQTGEMTIKENVSGIMPFNLDMDGALLKTATAQPLAIIKNDGATHYFFFAINGIKPEYVFDKNTVKGKNILRPVAGKNSTVKVKASSGQTIQITTLTKEEAMQTYKIKANGKERLVITAADLMQDGEEVKLQQTTSTLTATVFPANNRNRAYQAYTFTNQPVTIEPQIKTSGNRRLMVNVGKDAFEQVNDLYLMVDYTGDTMQAFIDGNMVSDNFYDGEPWQISLKRFKDKLTAGKGIYFYMTPLHADAPFLDDLANKGSLDFSKGNIAQFNKVKIVPEYKATFNPFK